jgi:signal transduction histidine kinase
VRRRSGALATVRTRTTLVTVGVVGVALAITGVVLVVALRDSLTDGVRTAIELRATDLTETLERGVAPQDLVIEQEEDLIVQVFDQSGRVVRASPRSATEPIVAPRAGRVETVEDVRLEEERSKVLTFIEEADIDGGGQYLVLVGRSLEQVDDSTDLVTTLLLVGFPLLLLLAGGTAWWLAGRALAPVESIRSEVAEISAAELHRRVPEPPGDDEIARLARTMNGMLTRLDDAQTRQRRFVSDASHELRSPVTTIRQHAEVAQAHPANTSVDDLAGTVLAEDLRLERLVDDLLWLARADEHRARPAPAPVDLDDLVLEEATRLRGSYRVAVDTAAVSGGQVLGDREQLRHMLRNLGDNAARHSGGSVALSVAERDGHVVLCVDDDGPGIPVEARSRVFERFARLDDARSRDVGGSGLGLAIVSEIVAAHDGTVSAGDAPIGGARPEVSLPAAP